MSVALSRGSSSFANVLLLAVGLSGCLTGEDPTSTDTMVTATMVDPWEDGETERVLFEGTVEAGECYGGAAAFELVSKELVMGGCAVVPAEQVQPILEGSQTLRIEADASQALQEGEYFAFLGTSVRTTSETRSGERTSEAIHEWTFSLEPGDWDYPPGEHTHAWIGLWSEEDVGTNVSILQGPIDVRLTVERDLGWEPRVIETLAPEERSELPDLGLPGTLTARSADYDWGPTILAGEQPGHAYPVDVRGAITYPADGEGPFPVVVLHHGQHGTCDLYPGVRFVPTCPDVNPVTEPVSSYRGYDYLAENLATHGYVVVSIDANQLNDATMIDRLPSDPGAGEMLWSYEDGANARGLLVLHTLDRLAELHDAPGSPVGDALVGKLDMDRIGLMGHSYGGLGVTYALVLNEERDASERHAIRAAVALAPSDRDHIMVPPHVAYATLLPYCDGDVWRLVGAEVYDRTRYDAGARTAPLVQVLAMGANHAFYNTAWLSDDAQRLGEHCSVRMEADGARHSPEGQRAEGLAIINGFLRAYAGGEAAFEDLFTGRQPMPASACPPSVGMCPELVHISMHPPAVQALMLETVPGEQALTRNALGGAVGLQGFAHAEVCLADTCPSRIARGSAHHLFLAWDAPARYTLELPSQHADLSTYEIFSFRAGVDPTDARNPGPGESQDVRVVLEDQRGRTASLTAGPHTAALFQPPGDAEVACPEGTEWCSAEAKIIANQVRLPLEAFAEQGVDLSHVASVALVFDQTASGAVQVTDLMFW